jgi:hypothetical protein
VNTIAWRLDDRRQRLGYQTAGVKTFVNVADGSAKELLTHTSDGYGGWLQMESSGCSD